MNKPCGYRVMIKPRVVEDKTKGGIILTLDNKSTKEFSAAVGQVVAMGPDAYTNVQTFPTGAWCAIGDWVMISKFAGHAFKDDGEEFRILNDDEIIAVVDDPQAISV